MKTSIALALIPLLLSTPAGAEPAAPPQVTHGVAVGEVTATSALVWVRVAKPGPVAVRLRGPGGASRALATAEREHDLTVTVPFEGLTPGTRYTAQVGSASATFQTAPAADADASVRVAFGGDLAGQNVCRDAEQGFPIFGPMLARHAEEPFDVFVALGDMIYSDNPCAAVGKHGNKQVAGSFGTSGSMADFWGHWRYNRESRLAELLAKVPVVAIWDDHEVVNDFGPSHHEGRLKPGLAAFLDYNPLHRERPLYRSFRWGRHLELVVLDGRRYRDPNLKEDSDASPKTMLGAQQRDWLLKRIAETDATWVVVVTSVPLSVPTGWPVRHGRDGWANFDQETGFERELLTILKAARDKGRRLAFITTDVHFATVLEHTPFPDTPDFKVREIVVGPLSAGLYPTRDLDPTLNPKRLFFHGPKGIGVVETLDEALGWFNYGWLEAGADALKVGIENGRGELVFKTSFRASKPASPR